MESSDFVPIGQNRYQRNCPICQGHQVIQRNFDDLIWHCLLCKQLSTPKERSHCTQNTLPCGHDTMYGDRDEPIETLCVSCNGQGFIIYTYLELVSMGLFHPQIDPVIVDGSSITPPQSALLNTEIVRMNAPTVKIKIKFPAATRRRAQSPKMNKANIAMVAESLLREWEPGACVPKEKLRETIHDIAFRMKIKVEENNSAFSGKVVEYLMKRKKIEIVQRSVSKTYIRTLNLI